jgi:HSP20 family molecular chaperone IbpA
MKAPMNAGDPTNWMWDEACTMIERADDIFETDREIWIIAALPGVETGDIEVSIDDDVVIIAGRRRLPAAARGAVIHRLEIPRGRFERRIRLTAGRLQLGRSELASGCLVLSLNKLA